MSQRFTEAELAAEYWAAMCFSQVSINLANKPGTPDIEYVERVALADDAVSKAGAFHRFATLPHAHDPEPRTVYAYDARGRCIGSFADPRPPEEPFRDWSINTGKDS